MALIIPAGPQVTAYKAAHEKDEKDPKKLKTEGLFWGSGPSAHRPIGPCYLGILNDVH